MLFTHTKEEIIVGPRTGKWHELAEAIRRGCKRFPKQALYALIMAAVAIVVFAAYEAMGTTISEAIGRVNGIL